jgi:hypothetical protein
MRMLKERLQILISAEQRRLLEEEAARRRTSVASVVREAIDAHYGGVAVEQRLRAAEEIAAMNGRFLSPEELEAVIGEERLESIGGLTPGPRS